MCGLRHSGCVAWIAEVAAAEAQSVAMRKAHHLDYLSRVPMFAPCSPKELELLARTLEKVSVPAGATIVAEGDRGEEGFIIETGEVVVSRGGEVVSRLTAGDYFGELAVIDRGRRNATVRSATPATLLVISHRALWALVDQVPALTHALLRGMAQRLSRADVAVAVAG